MAVLDGGGRLVEGHAGAIGPATNNAAEYRGLLEALRLARARGAEQVELFADSELIVQQVRGSYRVRHPDLKPLYAEAMGIIGGFVSFRIVHVPRERNAHADRLVNHVLDRELGPGERIEVGPGGDG